MDEFYYQTSRVPPFGSWDCYNDPPFTQCFESARSLDRDLYVAGDLYENDILTPAVIVVPRSKQGKKGQEKGKKVTCHCRAPKKAVDEDLYRISPHLLRRQPKTRRGWSIFGCCLQPTCVCVY